MREKPDKWPVTQPDAFEGTELLGEVHPLLDQLGSAQGLHLLSRAAAALQQPRVLDLASLTQFLQVYYRELLIAAELPAIHQAYVHATRHEARELTALDQALASQPRLKEFSHPSRRVGRSQLMRLRPLRDERVVQRYLQAVESGQAHGWHTLVYGLTLAVYSLPVRQGLVTYARQTLRGFIDTAAKPLHLGDTEARALVSDVCAGLPQFLDSLLTPNGIPSADNR